MSSGKYVNEGLLPIPGTGIVKIHDFALELAVPGTDFVDPEGVAGGQIVIGGTAAGNGLTFKSTSDATKGLITLGNANEFVVDEVNHRVGVGTAVPTTDLHVDNPGTDTFFKVSAGVGGAAGYFIINTKGSITYLQSNTPMAFCSPTGVSIDASGRLAIGVFVGGNANSTVRTVTGATVASDAAATWDGVHFSASTLTLTGSTACNAVIAANHFGIPTITDTDAVTVDQAATVYIEGGPIAAGSVTITRPLALQVGASSVFTVNTTNEVVTVKRTSSAWNSPGLIINDDHASGQAVVHFWANGALRGGIRADYVGGLSWFANGGPQTFYVGGDVNTTAMLLDTSGRVLAPVGIYSNSTASQNLTIGSTTHATKGLINIGAANELVVDEVNHAIRLTTASTSLDTPSVTLTNADVNGHIPLHFWVRGALQASFRADWAGNMSYAVAATGGHYFLTGGDFTHGTVRCAVDADGLFGTPDAAGNLKLRSTSNAAKGLIYLGAANELVVDEVNHKVDITGNLKSTGEVCAMTSLEAHGTPTYANGMGCYVSVETSISTIRSWTPGVIFNGLVIQGSTITLGLGAGAEVLDVTANKNVIIGTTTDVASSRLRVQADKTVASDAAAVWNGVDVLGSTLTLTGNTQCNAVLVGTKFGRPTITDADAVTVDNAATIYVENSPLGAGAGPATLTNTYSIFVDAGLCRFDGNGTHVFELPLDATGNATAAIARVPVKLSDGSSGYFRVYAD